MQLKLEYAYRIKNDFLIKTIQIFKIDKNLFTIAMQEYKIILFQQDFNR